jgi:hypothetical protein
MADAMEVSLLAFISTCADQDWDLTDSQVASITRFGPLFSLLMFAVWCSLGNSSGQCFGDRSRITMDVNLSLS